MGARYLPTSDPELLVWSDSYSRQLAVHGKTVGVDAAGIKEQQGLCADITSALQASEKAYTEWRAATARAAEVKARALKTLGARIEHLRKHPSCTEEIKAALGIVAPTPADVALAAHKIPLSLEELPGRVVVKWKKGPLEGVNVYGQRGQDKEWLLLGRDNRPPYEDTRPLAQPGVAEARRYRVVGVVADQEVTPPSDIVSITIGD